MVKQIQQKIHYFNHFNCIIQQHQHDAVQPPPHPCLEPFHHPKQKPCTQGTPPTSPFPPLPTPGNLHSTICLHVSTHPKYLPHTNRTTQYLPFVACPFSHSTVFPRCIHVLVCIRTSLLLKTEIYFIALCLPTHPLMDTWVTSSLWLL